MTVVANTVKTGCLPVMYCCSVVAIGMLEPFGSGYARITPTVCYIK